MPNGRFNPHDEGRIEMCVDDGKDRRILPAENETQSHDILEQGPPQLRFRKKDREKETVLAVTQRSPAATGAHGADVLACEVAGGSATEPAHLGTVLHMYIVAESHQLALHRCGPRDFISICFLTGPLLLLFEAALRSTAYCDDRHATAMRPPCIF